MADNVFGTPVTDATLKGTPEYSGKTITRLDRARVALQLMNAGSKAEDARRYVDALKGKYGDGTSTLCLVYNATGDTVSYATAYDWHGEIWAVPYPSEIANGQWGAFLHVHTTAGLSSSTGAVVYRGMNQDDSYCDWLLAWSSPFTTMFYRNHCYTEIRQYRHYQDEDNWNYIGDRMYDNGLVCSDEWNGCLSTVSIGNGDTAVFSALLTLVGAEE